MPKVEMQLSVLVDGEPVWAVRKELSPMMARRLEKENYDAALAAAGREFKAQVLKVEAVEKKAKEESETAASA